MNTDTSLAEKRRGVRFPVPGEFVDAQLLVGDVEIPVRLIDESSGGFGLFVESKPPIQRDDVIEVRTHRGRYRVRVAYVRPCGEVSRIHVVEQDGSGEIQTVAEPEADEQYCIGVESVEDLSFYRPVRKEGFFRRILSIPSRVTVRISQPVTLLSLIGCLLFPLMVFIAFTIVFQPKSRNERPSSTWQSRNPTAQRVSTRGFSPAARPKRLTTTRPTHSTESSIKDERSRRISLEDIVGNRSEPVTAKVQELLRDLFSEIDEDDPVTVAVGSGQTGESKAGSTTAGAATQRNERTSLNETQRQAILEIASEAQRRLEQGTNPTEIKQELRGAIREVLEEDRQAAPSNPPQGREGN